MKRVGLVRPPLVYVAIGLPERLMQLREQLIADLFERTARASTIVAYAESEADWLREWLGPPPAIDFVPFGVDVDAFSPAYSTRT